MKRLNRPRALVCHLLLAINILTVCCSSSSLGSSSSNSSSSTDVTIAAGNCRVNGIATHQLVSLEWLYLEQLSIDTLYPRAI